MQFVDDSFRQGRFQRPVILPIEVVTVYHAAGLLAIECRFPPSSRDEHAAAGVDENLAVIVDQSLPESTGRTSEAVTVAKILLLSKEENMPHVSGAIFVGIEGKFMTDGFYRTLRTVVDDQSRPGGVASENGEIYSLLENRHASRQGVASFTGTLFFFVNHIEHSYYLFIVMKQEKLL